MWKSWEEGQTPTWGHSCCNGTKGCSGKGEKHWCDMSRSDITRGVAVHYGLPPNIDCERDAKRQKAADDLINAIRREIVQVMPPPAEAIVAGEPVCADDLIQKATERLVWLNKELNRVREEQTKLYSLEERYLDEIFRLEKILEA